MNDLVANIENKFHKTGQDQSRYGWCQPILINSLLTLHTPLYMHLHIKSKKHTVLYPITYKIVSLQ